MANEGERPVRREKLSIYLAKSDYTSDDRLLKLASAQPALSVNLGDGEARLYIKREVHREPPTWSRLFTALPEVPDDAFGGPKSVGAVLVLKLDRTFLLSFGHGFHLINDESVERDFGLRVTLNSVEPEKLRSLDKASYDHNPLNYRTQSSRELDIFDLDLNAETDMLYAITGTSKEPLLGATITGRDALTIVVETDAKGLPRILRKALERYAAKIPQEFEWVDNVSRVRDQDELLMLDLLLNDYLSLKNPDNVWLGEPEIVDWESQAGYSFDQRPNSPRHLVLELSDLKDHLQRQGREATVDVLRGQLIYVNDANFQTSRSWTAYRCLYAEITSDGSQYVLRNATWYRVRESFVSAVDAFLSNMEVSAIQFPIYSYPREEDYNSAVAAADASFHLMDKLNTRIGGPYDKVEFCDLIKDSEALVHVKYYRSSATLSHLFAQANVAAETFVRDEGFRTRLNSKLPRGMKLRDPKQRPDPSKFRVVYAIATTKSLPSELPFFSKVTLKNAASTLAALNFKVELAQIAVDPKLLKTTKYKPNARAARP